MKQNFFTKLLTLSTTHSSHKEKVVNSEQYFANLKTLSSYKMDNTFLLYFQASLLLSLVFISSFLWYLLKSKYTIYNEEQISPNFLAICYFLFGIPFFVLSISIFYKPLIKGLSSILISLAIFLEVGVVFYDPSQYFSVPALFGSTALTIAIISVLVLLSFSFLYWRGLFWFLFLSLIGINSALYYHLSIQTFPEIYESSQKLLSETKPHNIIHIVIDNHINLPYLAEKEQKTSNLKVLKPILNFYAKNKFTLTPKAYSTYTNAIDETNNVLNFGDLDSKNIFPKSSVYKFDTNNGIDEFLAKSKYFEVMEKNGYNINIYQTDNLNLCDYENAYYVKSCSSFFPINSLTNNKELLSAYFSSFKGKILPETLPYQSMPISTLQNGVFDIALSHIDKAKGKNLFFIQVSSLKAPYIYDAQCNIVPEQEGFTGYQAQLSCTYKLLDKFISSLSNSNSLQHSKVIIHGLGGANLIPNASKTSKVYTTKEGFTLAKDMYMSIFASYKSNNKSFKMNKTSCDITTLLLRDLSNSNKLPCTPLDIKSFSLESIYNFNQLMQRWLNF